MPFPSGLNVAEKTCAHDSLGDTWPHQVLGKTTTSYLAPKGREGWCSGACRVVAKPYMRWSHWQPLPSQNPPQEVEGGGAATVRTESKVQVVSLGVHTQ